MGFKETAKQLHDKFPKMTPRQESERISDQKIPEKHLGKHSIETVGQEIFSLENTKPMFRDKKWNEKSQLIRKVCMLNIGKGDPHYQNLLAKLEQVELMR